MFLGLTNILQNLSSPDKTSTTETVTEAKELVEEVIPEKESQEIDPIDIDDLKRANRSQETDNPGGERVEEIKIEERVEDTKIDVSTNADTELNVMESKKDDFLEK